MLHIDPNVVTDIMEEINKNFGYLVISRGNTHDFSGMTIKIRNEKNAELIMKPKI